MQIFSTIHNHYKSTQSKVKYLTNSLSKYCASSGFMNGRFPFGWLSIYFADLSSCWIKNPAGVPAIGVGVAVSFRAGVRIGIYPAT
jgi:hypothetical protein